MKTSTFLKLFVATLTVFGFVAVLPASAARAPRPPSEPQPPTPVSGF